MSSRSNEIMNEDMMILGMVEVYGRYEGDHSQRHLEGSRQNQAMRGGEREAGKRRGREQRVPRNLEAKRLA